MINDGMGSATQRNFSNRPWRIVGKMLRQHTNPEIVISVAINESSMWTMGIVECCKC